MNICNHVRQPPPVVHGAHAVLAFLLAAAPTVWAVGAATPGLVTLHYIQRPPYMQADGGGLSGLTGRPSYKAFVKSGVDFAIKETPFLRQLRAVQENTGLDCMIGMFKKPERAFFAKYTVPIYRDQTNRLLVATPKAYKLEKVDSMRTLFSDKSLVFLAKLGYSYGSAIDALIDKFQPTVHRTADENLLMLKALKLGTADYMLIAPEEVAGAIAAAGYAKDDFRQLAVSDMPVGEYRYIMCSKNVSDETLEKINAAIAAAK